MVPSTFDGNEATEWGNLLELPIAQMYAKKTGDAVVAVPVLLRSIEHPFMLANVDFFIVKHDKYPRGVVTHVENFDEVKFDILAILEIKTGGLVGRASREWENDCVPTNYEYQGLHYAAVTGIRDVVFCALLGGQGLVTRQRTYGDFEVKFLEKTEADFWKHVQGKIPPEAIGVERDFEVLKAQYPQSVEGLAVEADDFIADVVKEYAETQTEIKQLESQLAMLRAKIEQVIGSAEALIYNNETLLTYKSSKSRESLNTKALAQAHPALVSEFTETKPGARVLRIRGGN